MTYEELAFRMRSAACAAVGLPKGEPFDKWHQSDKTYWLEAAKVARLVLGYSQPPQPSTAPAGTEPAQETPDPDRFMKAIRQMAGH